MVVAPDVPAVYGARTMHTRLLVPALATLGAALARATAMAQPQSDRGTFVTRLGVDTIAIETFARSNDRIEGDVAIRNPRTRTIHYVATLGSNGTIARFEMSSVFASAPAGTPPVIERVSTVTDTTLVTEVRRNGVRDTTASGSATLPVRGAVPFVQSGVAFFEQMVRQLRTSGRDSIEIPQYTFGPNHAFPSFVRRIGRDSVEINVGVPLLGVVDKHGRLAGLSGRATTVKTETARTPFVDLTSIIDSWAKRERAGNMPGAVSARDTVRAQVGTVDVWLDYGRPMRRGRAIFGALVPWDSVWRTGANAATQFRVSRDVTIGGADVPAGTYTLWTIPTRTGATLIVNKQNGQWGTQYDSTQNLVRIPLRVTTVSQPVERFTMEVTSTGAETVLRYRWDMREFSVPIFVK